MRVDHWMLFATFAEQRHFEYPRKGTYHGVVINANMAAHAPAGLAAFLLEKTAGMNYLVDPLTHAFQHDPEVLCNEDGEPKPALRNLADLYGEPVADRVGRQPVLPRHFADDDVLRGFTERCIRFQCDHLLGYMRSSEAAKYLDEHEAQLPPYAVIAPYFFLAETTIKDWLPICARSVRFAREAADRFRAKRVFASIVASQGVLADDVARGAIARTFLETGADGYILWVDDLDERTASKHVLNGLLGLTEMLRCDRQREVINLHGGYFSVLAAGSVGAGRYFTGVAHGPEFGEYRGVIPVGGGIPIARYYVPRLHARVRYRDALRLFTSMDCLRNAERFHEKICGCEECRSVLEGDVMNFVRFGEGSVKSVRRRHGIVRIEFPFRETKLRCLRHYLQRKRLEYEAAGTLDASDLLDELRKGAEEYENFAGLEGVSHLRLWPEVLSQARTKE